MTNTRPITAALFVLGVFVAGIVTGGALVVLGGHRGALAPHGPPPEHGPPRGPPRGPPDSPRGAGEQGLRAPPPAAHVVEMFQRRLDLDAAQTEQVRAIVSAQEATIGSLIAESAGRVEAVLVDGEARIRAILLPEQAVAFDSLVQERRSRFPDRPRRHRDNDVPPR